MDKCNKCGKYFDDVLAHNNFTKCTPAPSEPVKDCSNCRREQGLMVCASINCINFSKWLPKEKSCSNCGTKHTKFHCDYFSQCINFEKWQPEAVRDCDNCRFYEDMPDGFPCKDCIEKGNDNYLLWQPAANPSADDEPTALSNCQYDDEEKEPKWDEKTIDEFVTRWRLQSSKISWSDIDMLVSIVNKISEELKNEI